MSKLNQKLCSIILAAVLLFSTTPAAFAANKSTSHNLSSGALTLTAKNSDIRVYGSYDGYGAGIHVKEGYKGTITLDNVSIDARTPPKVKKQSPSGAWYETYEDPYVQYAICIEAEDVIINAVGDNNIYGKVGIQSNGLSLTGTGTLEIGNGDTVCGIESNGQLTIDVKTTVYGNSEGIEAGNIIINAETISHGGYRGIYAYNLTINAPTTVYEYGKNKNEKGAAIIGENIFINAPTYAEGEDGIRVNAYAAGFGGLTIKADTTAIGTNGYGVYSPTNITVDNATLTATGTKKGVQIGKGYKNITTGNGKIVAKTSK